MKAVSEILKQVFIDLQKPQVSRQQKLTDEWTQIMGRKLAPRTKPLLKDKGVLCVWVKDSVLAFELSQKYDQAVLKRAQAVLGEKEIQKVIFRIGE